MTFNSKIHKQGGTSTDKQHLTKSQWEKVRRIATADLDGIMSADYFNRLTYVETVPQYSYDPGLPGQWSVDTAYYYECIAPNTWRRIRLYTWENSSSSSSGSSWSSHSSISWLSESSSSWSTQIRTTSSSSSNSSSSSSTQIRTTSSSSSDSSTSISSDSTQIRTTSSTEALLTSSSSSSSSSSTQVRTTSSSSSSSTINRSTSSQSSPSSESSSSLIGTTSSSNSSSTIGRSTSSESSPSSESTQIRTTSSSLSSESTQIRTTSSSSSDSSNSSSSTEIRTTSSSSSSSTELRTTSSSSSSSTQIRTTSSSSSSTQIRTTSSSTEIRTTSSSHSSSSTQIRTTSSSSSSSTILQTTSSSSSSSTVIRTTSSSSTYLKSTSSDSSTSQSSSSSTEIQTTSSSQLLPTSSSEIRTTSSTELRSTSSLSSSSGWGVYPVILMEDSTFAIWEDTELHWEIDRIDYSSSSSSPSSSSTQIRTTSSSSTYLKSTSSGNITDSASTELMSTSSILEPDLILAEDGRHMIWEEPQNDFWEIDFIDFSSSSHLESTSSLGKSNSSESDAIFMSTSDSTELRSTSSSTSTHVQTTSSSHIRTTSSSSSDSTHLKETSSSSTSILESTSSVLWDNPNKKTSELFALPRLKPEDVIAVSIKTEDGYISRKMSIQDFYYEVEAYAESQSSMQAGSTSSDAESISSNTSNNNSYSSVVKEEADYMQRLSQLPGKKPPLGSEDLIMISQKVGGGYESKCINIYNLFRTLRGINFEEPSSDSVASLSSSSGNPAVDQRQPKKKISDLPEVSSISYEDLIGVSEYIEHNEWRSRHIKGWRFIGELNGSSSSVVDILSESSTSLSTLQRSTSSLSDEGPPLFISKSSSEGTSSSTELATTSSSKGITSESSEGITSDSSPSSGGGAASMLLTMLDPDYAGSGETWCGLTWTPAEIQSGTQKSAIPASYIKQKGSTVGGIKYATHKWEYFNDLVLSRRMNSGILDLGPPILYGRPFSSSNRNYIRLSPIGTAAGADNIAFLNTLGDTVRPPAITQTNLIYSNLNLISTYITAPQYNTYTIQDPGFMFGSYLATNGITYSWAKGTGW